MIIDPTGTHSDEAVDASSRRVAGSLLTRVGVTDLAERRIAFHVTPGFSYAAVQRGIWLAGGVAVPLALSHPEAEREYVIRDSEAALVVADSAIGDCVHVDDAMTGPEGLSLPSIDPGRRAMIVYTSGTTGRPKGVVTTHTNIAAQVDALVRAWSWTAADHLLLALPLHHVHGIINGLGSALAVRATCEILPAFDAQVVWDRFASGEVTVFTAVPTMYHRLVATWDAADSSTRRRWSDGAARLRLMMSGSAALPVTLLARWREITGHTLLERYGMTEIGMALSNPLAPVDARRPGFVGSPLPQVDVRIVTEQGVPVADGDPGELEVRGPNVFHEYWRRPQETAEAFRDGWFRTGDVAVREDGMYRLLGRASVDIIKTGGYKVSALEIEEVLRGHPAVADIAVVGLADDEWGERVAACAQVRGAQALTLGALQSFVRERLAPYKTPRALLIVDALPRNAMGKVVKPDVVRMFETS